MSRTIRLGVVQPRTYYGADEHRNVDEAVRYIAQAATAEVDLLLFPENYPGPYRHDNRFEVIEPLCRAAGEHGVAVAAGTSLETAPDSGEFHIAIVIIDASGELKGTYLRTHPPGPYIYEGGELWDFTYKESDELPVFDMGWGKLGCIICSEVFVPEVARALALKGAEVCLMPSGLLIDEIGFSENWRALVRARAIENLMYTATTVHLFPAQFGSQYYESESARPIGGSGLTSGLAMIASPESVLAMSGEPGLITADLDLDRIRWLRNTDEELIIPAPYRTIPGVLKWRRPHVFRDVLGREQSTEPPQAS